MDFTLCIGDYAYSSWSLRGWLLFDAFGIPATLDHAHMRTQAFADLQARMAPSQQVPAVRISAPPEPDVVVWDTLAIAETLHDHHPKAGIWPAGRSVRPSARSLAAEMHAGFTALRSACPMNLRRYYAGFEVDQGVKDDLARLARLWTHARTRPGRQDGPFLFGAFSAADVFFAPVASRILTYELPMAEDDLAYVAALLGHPSVRRWRAMALADPHTQAHYEFDLADRPDPLLPDLVGAPDDGQPENTFCPFTGQDIGEEGIVLIGDRRLGFADRFQRDKVAADPLAWEEVRALLKV